MNLQVRKGVVGLPLPVVHRLNIFDQPGFQEQGVDLAFRLEKIDVANLGH